MQEVSSELTSAFDLPGSFSSIAQFHLVAQRGDESRAPLTPEEGNVLWGDAAVSPNGL